MNVPTSLRKATSALLLGLLAPTIGACTGSDAGQTAGGEDDLTSVTARARKLEFVGTIYVEPGASDAAILDTARKQAQTAFGPLLAAKMAVNSRELKEIDATTFVKRPVQVMDPATSKSREMLEVKYTYRDDAVVDVSYANRSTVPLALMNPSYRTQSDRILRECTPNDEHAREFSTSIWYVFDPSLPQCSKVIRAEQEKVDEDRRRLENPETEVAKSEVDRLYIPITAQLGAAKTNRGDSYPDYHRLFRGGVMENKLVVSLVFGMIDKQTAEPEKDFNWGELMSALEIVMAAHGDFVPVDGPDPVDIGRYELSSGKVVEIGFGDLVRLSKRGAFPGFSAAEAKEIEAQFAKRVHKRWMTVEKPLRVSVGGEAPRDFAIRLQIYFGASMSPAPHKLATKTSDVFIYNGHSSIGYGPLDPRNFSAADFPSTYQIMWIDGCVSYNYYHKDYVPLKEGGTKNLDLVTNGLEAPAWRGGTANGKFLAALLGGAASYKDLLLAARDTEALRVVDGELDNDFDPASAEMKVTIAPR